MYEYLQGEISHKNPTYVVIDVGGIGYHVNISLNTYAAIEKEERVRLLTHLHVKEDLMELYGFYSEEERNIFELLIKVSGIGTNTARLILSSLKAEEVQIAILNEDVASFKSVKGIGPKTAKRIILDLKDKIDQTDKSDMLMSGTSGNTLRQEAFSALIALGFQQGRVNKALNKVQKKDTPSSAEDYIKEALKILS
jgi:Holliday junction DNA helicase RuvA